MIIDLNNGAPKEQVDKLCAGVEAQHIRINKAEGANKTILGLAEGTHKIDMNAIKAQKNVESVQYVQKPYKGANRKFHSDDTVVNVQNLIIENGNVAIIDGPCSIESEERIIDTCMQVKAAGGNMLCGGAFKPVISPCSFHGICNHGRELPGHSSADSS